MKPVEKEGSKLFRQEKGRRECGVRKS
ncbi:hypothetical protein NC653_007086 [Populus alba x Populus x berolinensis]|uniref:Uncharacterized protein n=1 Tax=Populus alba x Populus x berolinensis TaxID=444605 RepID=A0AAD6WF90_9ROSI|nr:hypothetical protein NC653_007086 [Populus alba x Populus x berolinensis]